MLLHKVHCTAIAHFSVSKSVQTHYVPNDPGKFTGYQLLIIRTCLSQWSVQCLQWSSLRCCHKRTELTIRTQVTWLLITPLICDNLQSCQISSCVARSSSACVFTWYKYDWPQKNVTYSRGKWFYNSQIVDTWEKL